MKREERITKDCCDIKWEWSGSRLRGLENTGWYVVIVKSTGYRFPYHFSSKRAASAWLGKQVKIANQIKARIIEDKRNKSSENESEVLK